jgi:predicted dehydrogenase
MSSAASTTADSDRTLRIGILGAGGMAKTHTRHWSTLQQEGGVEVIAVADANREAADGRAAEFEIPNALYSADDLFALKPDIIDIILPNRLHCEMTCASLEAGCHTICEKPLAIAPAEVEQMIASAEKSGRLLMAAQNMRFDAATEALKRAIDGGELGEVYHVNSTWLRRRGVPGRQSFYQRATAGGGPTIDLAVHMLDHLMFLTGNFKPVSVTGVTPTKLAGHATFCGSWGDWDPDIFDVEDFGAAFIRFADGMTAMVEVSWLSNIADQERRQALFLGTRGGATFPQLTLAGEEHGSLIDSKLAQFDGEKGHLRELREFARAVRQGGPSPVPPTESLQVARVLDAWYESNRVGREVRLD